MKTSSRRAHALLSVSCLVAASIAGSGCESGGGLGSLGGLGGSGGGSSIASTLMNQVLGEWQLKSLGGMDVSSMLPGLMGGSSPKLPSINFAEDGGVSGFSGVNRFSGKLDPAMLASGKLDLSQLVSTKMAGSPEANATESALMQALGQAKSFKVGSGSSPMLSLLGGSGSSSPLATFIRAAK
jgi:heat shock protein HslJ